MGLADRLETANTLVRKGPRCYVGAAELMMNDEDLKAFRVAMSDSSYSAAAIVTALRDEGFGVKDCSVRRHRRGLCACGDVA